MSSMNKVLTVLLLGAMSLQCSLPGYAKNCSKRVMRTRASFYGEHFAGKKTASGAIFNPNGMTAASNHLPLGSKVLVRNEKNGKTAKVTITDRGGCAGRGVDLSKGAACKIGMKGVAPVSVRVLKTGKNVTASR